MISHKLIRAVNELQSSKDGLLTTIAYTLLDAVAKQEYQTIFKREFLKFELSNFGGYPKLKHYSIEELMDYIFAVFMKAYGFASKICNSHPDKYPVDDKSTYHALKCLQSCGKARSRELDDICNGLNIDHNSTVGVETLAVDMVVHYLDNVLQSFIMCLEKEVKVAQSIYKQMTEEEKQEVSEEYEQIKSISVINSNHTTI